MIEQPFFLVGAERSGTTLLRLMLSHHSQIAWCNEFEYSVEQISPQGNFPALADYYNWLDTHRIFQATGFKIDHTLSYPELVNDFLLQKKEQQHKPIVGATVHHHFDRLLSIWPEARFIHLVRDGRDVALSCIREGWAGNVWTGCERWQEAELLWEKLQQKITSDRTISLTYEQLIRQPQATLAQLCGFIGVPYEDAMLDYAKDTTYQNPDPRLICQWQIKLSPYEIQLLESKIGDFLSQRGYSLTGLSKISLTEKELQKIKRQDWWYRANFRRKRYGNFLFLVDYISRRCNLKQWQKSIKLKLNQIDAQYLK